VPATKRTPATAPRLSPEPPAAFPAEEFRRRRAAVLEAIGRRAAAVIQGAPRPRGFEVFRQSNEFHYLCGVEVPHACLLLDGRRGTAVLLLPDGGPGTRDRDGPGPSAQAAEALAAAGGVDNVRLAADLASSLRGAARLYAPHAPAEGRCMCRDTLRAAEMAARADPWDGGAPRHERFLRRLARAAPRADLRDLTPILDSLRLVKSAAELSVLRRAGRLAALAVAEAMRCTRPGLREYHLGAVADYVYAVHGARGGGYAPIIAGGANAWDAHYCLNRSPLRGGDLVLMDYAPDVAGYTSDIGRLWPVGGTFSPRQRELYGFVAAYHQALLRRLRPGAMARDVLTEAAAHMDGVLRRTRFSRPIYAEAARRMLAFAGHLSHPVGMAVHDPGDYRPRPLVPGIVLAVDPQMWVPEERLYVRVEDTVAVTADGVEVLTAGAPLEAEAVEAILREDARFAFPPPGRPPAARKRRRT